MEDVIVIVQLKICKTVVKSVIQISFIMIKQINVKYAIMSALLVNLKKIIVLVVEIRIKF